MSIAKKYCEGKLISVLEEDIILMEMPKHLTHIKTLNKFKLILLEKYNCGINENFEFFISMTKNISIDIPKYKAQIFHLTFTKINLEEDLKPPTSPIYPQ